MAIERQDFFWAEDTPISRLNHRNTGSTAGEPCGFAPQDTCVLGPLPLIAPHSTEKVMPSQQASRNRDYGKR